MNVATSLLSTKRWTLAVVCAATAMLMLDIAVVNTALSRIADDLDTGLSGLQWVVDAYTLALASVVLTAGSLADRFGRRRLFTIGLAIFTVASAACAASTDIVFLDVARAVQGIGAAIMFAVSLALLANAYPDIKERAGALAAYGATIGALLRHRPARRRRADQWPRLAVDLPHQHPDRASSACGSRAPRSRSRAIPPRRPSTCPARSRSPPASSYSCSRCCAATRSAGAARRSSPSSPAPPWRSSPS